MSESAPINGKIELFPIKLRKIHGDEKSELDISAMVVSFSLLESVYSADLTAELVVLDYRGILSEYPLIGEEIVHITFEDPFLGSKIGLEFFSYAIERIEASDNNLGFRYAMKLKTKTSFNATIRRVVTAFDDLASKNAHSIFSNTYNELPEFGEWGAANTSNGSSAYEIYDIEDGRKFILELTDGAIRCVIPNYTPQRALNYIASRSYSFDRSRSCSFKFFETKFGYFFVTDELLMRRAVSKSENEEVKELIYDPSYRLSPENIEAKNKSVKSVEQVSYVNTEEDLFSGAYNSRVEEIDVLYGQVNRLRLTHELQSEMFGVSGHLTNHSKEFVESYFNEENERVYTFVRDYDMLNDIQIEGNQNIPMASLSRMSYEYKLNRNRVVIKIEGRFDISAGDILKLNVMAHSATANPEGRSSNLDGHYLATEVVHQIHFKDLVTTITACRYDIDTAWDVDSKSVKKTNNINIPSLVTNGVLT